MTRRITGLIFTLMLTVVLLLAAVVTAKNANTTARQRDYPHAIANGAATLCIAVCGVHLLKRNLLDCEPDPTERRLYHSTPPDAIPVIVAAGQYKTHPDWLSPDNRRHLART